MCYFYILYSDVLDKYYYDYTCDTLEARLRRHLSNHKGFTGRQSDWELVYQEPYATKTEVYQRELEIKKWKSRKRVELLIYKNK